MVEIFLMRHGDVDRPGGAHAQPGDSLNGRGKERMRQAAVSLPRGSIGIVCSSLLRARQSAAILAAASGLRLVAEIDELAEWCAPRRVWGLIPTAYPPEYQEWRVRRFDEPDLAFEDGESLSQLYRRASRAALRLEKLSTQVGPLTVVSHGVVMGVVTRLGSSPSSAFAEAIADEWAYAELRPWDPLAAHRFTRSGR